MWVVAFFDLPTETRENRRDYARFRKKLIQDGFVMLQYSVYGRPCATWEAADKHAARVEQIMPPVGQVRVLSLTAQQFARMRVFHGEIARSPEKEPQQLTFF